MTTRVLKISTLIMPLVLAMTVSSFSDNKSPLDPFARFSITKIHFGTILNGALAGEDSWGIVLEGPCKDFEEQIQAIRSWSQSLGEATRASSQIFYGAGNSSQSGATTCSAEIRSILPEFVEKNLGKSPASAGPNCFDTVLVLNHLVPGLRFASPHEMEFWLESPLCHKLRKTEPKRAGDIVVGRNSWSDPKFRRMVPEAKPQEPWHAFEYVSDDLAFQKNDAGRSEYEFVSTEYAYLRGGTREVGCRQASGSDCNDKEYANVLRCIPLSQYMQKRASDVPDPLKLGLSQLDRAECIVSEHFFGGKGNFPGEASGILSAVEALAGQGLSDLRLTKQKVNLETAETRKFLWESVLVRVDSLRRQLAM